MKDINEITLGEALDIVLSTNNATYDCSDDLLDALTDAFWIMFKELYYGE